MLKSQHGYYSDLLYDITGNLECADGDYCLSETWMEYVYQVFIAKEFNLTVP